MPAQTTKSQPMTQRLVDEGLLTVAEAWAIDWEHLVNPTAPGYPLWLQNAARKVELFYLPAAETVH